MTVAVASSLRTLWPRLESAWRETLPGVAARPTFGASRTLARQIARGAPFELLLAADEESIERLPAARTDAARAGPYAIGRLVLMERVPPHEAPADATAESAATRAADGTEDGADDSAASTLARFVDRLGAEPALRLAIPNPAHAPYGRAAREALERAGAWPLASGRLVVGENAAQTLQFVLAGAVDSALVPLSLVADTPPPGTRATLVTADAHAPLVHRLVTVPEASDAARALAAWFLGDAARAVLDAGGFDAPSAADAR